MCIYEATTFTLKSSEDTYQDLGV